MARHTQDREDLLRDATGLIARAELAVPETDARIVCGFRDDGALSVYWGQEEVVQFNALGELRRAFWQGHMVACYRRQLHWLDRRSDSGRTRLAREPFTPEESDRYLTHVQEQLAQLQVMLDEGDCRSVGKVPAEADVEGMVSDWLREHTMLRLANHPGLTRGR